MIYPTRYVPCSFGSTDLESSVLDEGPLLGFRTGNFVLMKPFITTINGMKMCVFVHFIKSLKGNIVIIRSIEIDSVHVVN